MLPGALDLYPGDFMLLLVGIAILAVSAWLARSSSSTLFDSFSYLIIWKENELFISLRLIMENLSLYYNNYKYIKV